MLHLMDTPLALAAMGLQQLMEPLVMGINNQVMDSKGRGISSRAISSQRINNQGISSREGLMVHKEELMHHKEGGVMEEVALDIRHPISPGARRLHMQDNRRVYLRKRQLSRALLERRSKG
jgi:hypothetical protein